MCETKKDKKIQSIKVLFVIKGSALNRGMNTGLENLAWGLSEKGIEVHVLSGGTPPNNYNYKIPQNTTYYFSENSGDNPINFVKPAKKILTENKIDAIIGWSINIAPLVEVVGDQNIVYLANQGQLAPRSLALSFAKKILTKKIPFNDALKVMYHTSRFPSYVTKVISISNSVQASCIKSYGFDPTKCVVIPRGIDTETYSKQNIKTYKIGQEKINILYAGNIQKSKGIDDLVESLKMINHPVRLILCGKGDLTYIKSIKAKLYSFNLGHDLVSPGALSQKRLVQYYNDCDMFVFPSHSEGLGKALIEAMSCSCPVICSDIDTFKEIIIDSYNGLMFKVKSPKSLADAILRYISNPQLREHCGNNARETVEEYFCKKTEISRWISILKNNKKI